MTTLSHTSNASRSLEMSAHDKYGGLIKKSLFKRVISNLIDLYTYVFTESMPFRLLHMIISVIRLIQIAGPALASSFYYDLWNRDSLSKNTISVLSVFWFTTARIATFAFIAAE